MRFVSLDQVVCSTLISRGYPVHYYMPFMNWSINCLKEIHQRHMAFAVIPKRLLLDENKSTQIPEDCQMLIKVGYLDGQRFSVMTQDDSLTVSYNRNSEGDAVPHGTSGDYSKAGVLRNFDSNGNDLGGNFGASYSPGFNKYKVIPYQNRIQVSESYPFGYIDVEFVTDGTEFDNTTKILPILQPALVAYNVWQLKENSRAYGLQERQIAKAAYDEEIRVVRANMADWSMEDILDILRSANYLKY